MIIHSGEKELHTDKTKEISTAEAAECLRNLKVLIFVLLSCMPRCISHFLYIYFILSERLNYLLIIYIFQDDNEPKRKATKKSTKSEKELLELTLMYQKAITERDSGKFSITHFLSL